jgi:hypothetical protein
MFYYSFTHFCTYADVSAFIYVLSSIAVYGIVNFSIDLYSILFHLFYSNIRITLFFYLHTLSITDCIRGIEQSGPPPIRT